MTRDPVGSLVAVRVVGAGKAAVQDTAFISTGTAVAAGAGDNTEVEGATIDRTGHETVVVSVPFSAVLAEAATLSVRVQRQTSADDITWGAATAVFADAVVATGEAGGSTETGVVEVEQSLAAVTHAYIRYNVRPNLSAGATDTAVFGAVAVLSGKVGSGGSGTEVTGETVDRLGFQSAVVAVPFRAVLAEAATLSLRLRREQSDDGSSWDAAETVSATAVVATGETGGSVEVGVLEADQDLDAVKRYVRYSVTPTLSAPTTDACEWGASVALGSAADFPV